MPTIVHFEIPADELERAKKFYAELFGWKIEKYAGPMTSPMEYWMITTTNEKGEKAIEGGMMQRQNPQQPITNYIDVPSIDEYSSKVETLGGKVVVPKTAVPGMGYFAVCLDTENNSFAIWETDTNAK
ncbi:MAG: VOC family protein [Gammaproteobacteria bacterium]|nr:MAG: VOC family protein [Gammaproteobacteria bacterium]